MAVVSLGRREVLTERRTRVLGRYVVEATQEPTAPYTAVSVLVHAVDVCENLQAVPAAERLKRRGGVQILEMVLLPFRPPHRPGELARSQMLSDMFAAFRPVFRALATKPAVQHRIIPLHGRTESAPLERQIFTAKVMPF